MLSTVRACPYRRQVVLPTAQGLLLPKTLVVVVVAAGYSTGTYLWQWLLWQSFYAGV